MTGAEQSSSAEAHLRAEPPAPGERFASPQNREVPVAAPAEFRPLTLGSLTVWPPVVLAPMAGVTNHAFRSLCREYGAGLYVSEMITARGYLNGNARTRALARPHESELPRSIQVYGSDPMDLGEMVRMLVDEGVDHLDLNLGCHLDRARLRLGQPSTGSIIGHRIFGH